MSVPVTVIVPCYRCRDTVARAVASVTAQTAPPLEVLLVDDGSVDGTAPVLASLCSERVRVLRLERNQGPGSARNAGWQAARGEFVAFLDADDTWHPRKLEIQVAFMRQHPEFALSGHGHVFGSDFGRLPDAVPHVEITGRALLLSNRFVTPSVMLRRDLAARFRDGQRHMEDHLLWMQLALAGHRIARIELALASLHKPQFGAGGQSGDLHAMERAELGNYRLLRREGKIGLVACGALLLWSVAKYLRRLALVGLRGLRGT